MNAVLRHQDVAALAASGESETLEFKASTGTRRDAAMTVCAFLDQRCGQRLFGVTRDCAEKAAGTPSRAA